MYMKICPLIHNYVFFKLVYHDEMSNNTQCLPLFSKVSTKSPDGIVKYLFGSKATLYTHKPCPNSTVTEQSTHWLKIRFLCGFGTCFFFYRHIAGLKIARRNFAVQIKKEEGHLRGGRDTILGLYIFFLENEWFK